MKSLALVALLAASASFAQVSIKAEALGSGTPGTSGQVTAAAVDATMYHVPQYMPAYPTAATIWPRVIEVPCTRISNGLKCDGYTWTPELGRAEYLFVKPVIREVVAVPTPTSVITHTHTITKEITIKEVPVIVLKEVPVKKKPE